MLSVMLAFGFLALVSGQASRCCMSRKWSAVMTDVREVARGNKVTSDFYYDFDNKAIAIQFYRFGDRYENLTRIVTKYSQNVRYSIDPDGSCTAHKIEGEEFLPNCIPADATYLGSNYIGEETNGLKYDGWTIPLGRLTLTMSFSDPGCVPILEGAVGTVTSGPVDAVYNFNGYKKGVNQAAFSVPAGC